MLDTPLGAIEIEVDHKSISYEPIKINTHRRCRNLDGRYLIKVSISPDENISYISCKIKDYIPVKEASIESGERLELISFYQGKTKLSLGTIGDIDYCDRKRFSLYDYDVEYLPSGIQYVLLPETQTIEFLFGIAWVNVVNSKNDVHTWFGADPREICSGI